MSAPRLVELFFRHEYLTGAAATPTRPRRYGEAALETAPSSAVKALLRRRLRIDES